ncbi:MAG: hypothetical protein DRJ40_08580 [Thermoprotei archaeon]|nr:MAG: hypothetical protein DRJ40_08580 [Thermoprotei archaeon]
MSRLATVFYAIGGVLIFFLLAPLLIFVATTDLNYVLKYGFDEEATSAMYIGMLAATTSTLILLILGTPLAYALARYRFPGKGLIEAVIDLPLAIPHGVVGIMVLLAYSSRAPLGTLLANLGMRIEDSFWGIVFAMVFVSVPLAVDTIKEGFDMVDPEIEYVARSLGASELMTFMKISLPLVTKHIITAALLSWARAMSEVGAILVVAYFPKSINVLVMERFWTYGLEVAKATAFPLLITTLTAFTVVRVLGGRK